MKEILVSVDVEADGPIPGPHSLLSLGAVAFSADGTMHGSFSANLLPLDNASPHPATMAFWAEHPAAFAATQADRRPPEQVMEDFWAWLMSLNGPVIFVGMPAAFDFTWVYWYSFRFLHTSPFGHTALDVRSLAMGVLKCSFAQTSQSHLPRHWIPDAPHTHVALDDAANQAELCLRILREHGIPASAA